MPDLQNRVFNVCRVVNAIDRVARINDVLEKAVKALATEQAKVIEAFVSNAMAIHGDFDPDHYELVIRQAMNQESAVETTYRVAWRGPDA
jgi:hypothetical protein